MNSNGTSSYRTIGRTLRPIKPHHIFDDNVDDVGGFIEGDVIMCAAGNKMFALTCAAIEPGSSVILRYARLREYFASGSAVKPKLRVVFTDAELTVTRGSQCYIPWNQIIGEFYVEDTDWKDVKDDATATNGGAIAEIKNINVCMAPDMYATTIYCVVLGNESDATGFASGAIMDADLYIELT